MVMTIRVLKRQRKTIKAIVRETGVSRSTVKNISAIKRYRITANAAACPKDLVKRHFEAERQNQL